MLVTADRLSYRTNSILKPFDISKEQFNVLRILKGQKNKPISLHSVSERMISQSSNATRLVEKLRVKGLVNRNQCPSDRRQVDIMITEKGVKLLETVNPLVLEDGNRMRSLSEKEAQQLNELLEKMRG